MPTIGLRLGGWFTVVLLLGLIGRFPRRTGPEAALVLVDGALFVASGIGVSWLGLTALARHGRD